MALYEVGKTKLKPVNGTTFDTAGIRERTDLQRLLRDHVEAVSPDTLVISEEFGEWTESRRKVDLLGIDKDANIVVIELKRTEDGGHMELQGIRYAAMVSTLTSGRAVEIFSKYLKVRDRDDDAKQRLLDFLEWDEFDEDEFAQDVRLVLVSANFSRELTTAVLWLNEKDLDIRCVRIKPYSYESQTLIDVQQVIPLPEATEYQVQVREKKRQERKARQGSADFTRYNVVVDDQVHPAQWKRNAILLAVKGIWGHGVSPDDIAKVIEETGKGGLFKVVPEATKDPERFRTLAVVVTTAEGRQYKDSRWHTDTGDLLVYKGKTYALTNQWGRRKWLKAMELLQERFPDVGLQWSPCLSAPDKHQGSSTLPSQV